MDKAPDAFRTISEVADDLDIPQHVLRFWESRFTQIRPMKRGGGRRYYRPDDVALLRGIRHLLYGQGYTIRGVQRILREQGIGFVQTVWQEGAEQPERADEDEVGTDRATSAAEIEVDTPEPSPAPETERREPTFATPTHRITRANVAARPDGAVPVAGISASGRAGLRSVLDDLADCRRLLDAALQDQS